MSKFWAAVAIMVAGLSAFSGILFKMKKERVLTIIVLQIFILAAFCPTIFSKQGTLTGQVVDGFDNVLKDVEIKIKGTKSSTKTDENGQYRISFHPGKVEISFGKKGYATREFLLNMHDTTEVAMQKLILWKLPESGGMFLVRMDDYKKIEKMNYFSKRDDNSISFYAKGNPTKIICPDDSFEQGGIEMMILDYSKESPLVVGKSLYRLEDDNLIGSIIYKSGDWSINNIHDEYSKISNRLGLRYVELEPGRYFYCIGEITLRSKVGYGYYFEVTTSGLSDKKDS
jgi:hypothetical protein